jgi:hypothetical protein
MTEDFTTFDFTALERCIDLEFTDFIGICIWVGAGRHLDTTSLVHWMDLEALFARIWRLHILTVALIS